MYSHNHKTLYVVITTFAANKNSSSENRSDYNNRRSKEASHIMQPVCHLSAVKPEINSVGQLSLSPP
jgi:hypothetical protein